MILNISKKFFSSLLYKNFFTIIKLLKLIIISDFFATQSATELWSHSEKPDFHEICIIEGQCSYSSFHLIIDTM